MAEDTVLLLRRTLDHTAGVVDGVRPEQRSLPTPCTGWTVDELLGHMLVDVENLRVRATGGTPDWSRPHADGDAAAAGFRDGAGELVAAWEAQPPDPGGPVAGQTIAEIALHTWDLERSLGLETQVPEEAAALGLTWMRSALKPEYRGRAFGPEVSVTGDAPVIDRLVAFSGRDPRWTPPER